MPAQITLDWKKDSTFETQLDGHTVSIDTSKEDGGTDSGVRPKALMLVAMAGCSGVDVISLFKNRILLNGTELNIQSTDK